MILLDIVMTSKDMDNIMIKFDEASLKVYNRIENNIKSIYCYTTNVLTIKLC